MDRQKELKEITDGLLLIAKAILEDEVAKGGELIHMAFPLNIRQRDFTTIPLSGDPMERKAEVSAIHLNLKANDRDGLVIISDNWCKTVPKGMTLEEAISQYDRGLLKKTEAIITLSTGEGLLTRTIVTPYTRKSSCPKCGYTGLLSLPCPKCKSPVTMGVEWGEQSESHEAKSWMIPPQWATPVAKGQA